MDAQATGLFSIECPSDTGVTFHSMGGVDGISQLFVYELDVRSTHIGLRSGDWVGQRVTVHLQGSNTDEDARQWNGIVAAFQYVDTGDDGLSRYRITLRPWLWYLTRSADCRIFQNKSVPDIITQVFRDRGFTDFESALQESYPRREYVVQYRETDHNFVSRLMDRDGIYYFFRHAAGKHTLVLADSPHIPEPAEGAAQLPYAPPNAHRDETLEYVMRWRTEDKAQTSRVALSDYDFTRPRLPLYALRETTDTGDAPSLEAYDYPGGFSTLPEGDGYAQLRLEQRRDDVQEFFGETNARALSVGSTFELADHPRQDQNAKYLVVSARYHLRGSEVRSAGVAEDIPPFSCIFRAIHAKTTFRAPQRARKALVRGPQTARVVGPADQEIWTDQHGRVKVQFHWDRGGRYDENSSCFVRVAQPWAGSGWGAQFIPRVGHEVIVDFLEGDPDRPIITGSVYNGSNKPPFPLPRNQTQSGIRTRSTPGGTPSNGNEIRFEDAIGREDLFVQAERTQTTHVKTDQTITIGGNRFLAITGHEKITVDRGRATGIAGGDVLTVAGTRNTEVGGDDTRHVVGLSFTEIDGDATTHVLGVSSVTIGGSSAVHVAGVQTTVVAGPSTSTTLGSRTTTVAGDDLRSIGGKHTLTVGAGGQNNAESDTYVWGTYRVGAQDTVTIDSAKAVVLRCGTTELRLTPDSLELLGRAIHAVASKEVQLTGSGPSIRVADDIQATSKEITLVSSGARLALSDTAKLTGSQVQLGSGSGRSPSPGSSSQSQTKTVTLTFVDTDHEALANCHYVLEVGGQTAEGTTDGAGSLTATVPQGATAARCTVWTGLFPEGSRVTYRVALEPLEGASTIKGAQQRLKNLGYYLGSVTGVMNDATHDALLAFQHAQGLQATGVLDGPTTGKLGEIHN